MDTSAQQPMMKAATFNGPGVISLDQYSVPEPAPGWVRLAVQSVGICGSDLHLLAAHNFPNKGMRPGHEIAGIIDATGDGVKLRTGTHVTVEPLTGCGTCFSCETGHINRCRDFSIFGLHQPGAMADYVIVPASLLYEVPASIDPAVVALTEPMAVVVRGLRMGGSGLGSRIAVLGAGSLGLLAIVAAKCAGVAEIHVSARYPHQAALATALGATSVHEHGQALLKAVGPDRIDTVYETVGGHSNTLIEAGKLARPGGKIVVLGTFEGNSPVPMFEFSLKELTMHGSVCYAHDRSTGDFAIARDLVVSNASALAQLISHRFGLDQLQEAFTTAADKRSGALKIQIQPSNV